jgi:hypothetical protein
MVHWKLDIAKRRGSKTAVENEKGSETFYGPSRVQPLDKHSFSRAQQAKRFLILQWTWIPRAGRPRE